MEAKIKTLIDSLIEKTDKKEALWERVGKSDQFLLTLSSGKVSTDKFVTKQGVLVYQFIIYNVKGEPIVSINGIKKQGVFLEDQDYDIIKRLHESIKHNYFKVDETIEGLLSETKKPGEIGKESDDFPF
jgi:hypothetical protein